MKRSLVWGAILSLLLIPLVLFGFVLTIASLGGGNDLPACAATAPASQTGEVPALPDITLDGRTATAEQLSIAQTIVYNGQANQYNERDILVVLMIGIQESRLINLPYGDRDSLGVFQLRPSQGWGTPEQIMDVNYASNKVFDAVQRVSNRDQMELIDIAMKVMRPSAEAYRKSFHAWQPVAEQLLAVFLQDITDPPDGCSVDLGVAGKVIVAPGANLPGKPIQPETMAFLEQVAGIYGQELIVTTGTDHSFFVKDSERVSEHIYGYAADFGMQANGGTTDGPVGDAIARACLIAAGIPADQATTMASQGGLWTVETNDLRVQCIWKTNKGGDHHDHVHIGASPK